MKIARVFPTKTNMTPLDLNAYYSAPGFFTPKYDAVHISCVFTWDVKKAQQLALQWQKIAPVTIGGPAVDGESDQPFVPGMSLKNGITITSRGCVNNCSFCMVRRGLIEFDNFPEGNIVQDNNILACSTRHWRLVIDMLKKQRRIEFKGGLDKYRIIPQIAEDIRGLKIKTLWLACDRPQGIKPLRKAVEILRKAGFTRNHIYCYVLIGDDYIENLSRLKEVWEIGAMPFAQLLRNKEDNLKYPKRFYDLQRDWSRPAITRAINKKHKVEKELFL
jgi:hypothetical protein